MPWQYHLLTRFMTSQSVFIHLYKLALLKPLLNVQI